MRIGMDFGTTNSGAAWFDGSRVHLFPIDRANAEPQVIRSTLYIDREHCVTIGRQAVETYYEQNVGRPTRLVKKWAGEMDMISAELFYVMDIWAYEDELLPGRLLRSLKSVLATDYEGTTIFNRFYSLEELLAIYLRRVREQAETLAGEAIDAVVLGRPVHFSSLPGGDERAVARLSQAAHMAGFAQVDFELEPVAAALDYARRLDRAQTIVVFDFGGGTLDVTLMRVGGHELRRLYAAGGVPIAGDRFDQRLIETMLLEHFGRGTTFGYGVEGHQERFPEAILTALSDWQTVLDLNKPDTLRLLRNIEDSSSHPVRVRQLRSLIVNNYAVKMYDTVEQAKIALSDLPFAVIAFDGQDLDVWQPVTRDQFELAIEDYAREIEACVLDTLARSGLQASDVDAVVRTGGSANIPAFVDMLGRLFDPGRVVTEDIFSGVTSGLAIRAWELDRR